MKKIIYKVRKHLRNEPDIKKELEKIITTLGFVFLSLGALVISAVFDYIFGSKLNFLMDCGLTFIFIICIFLITNGWYYYSKIILIVSAAILLVVNGSTDGIGVGNYFIWFPVICSIFLIFNDKNMRTIIALVAFCVVCIFFVIITHNSYFLQNDIIHASYSKLDFILCFIISLLLIVFFIFNLIKSNKKNEQKMKRLILNLNAANDDLTKANTELDSFVYKASHDLRSPLTSVLGLINLLKIEKDQSKFSEYVELQEKAVRKLDSYIYDILNISKNARMGVEMDNINFEEIINNVFEQLGYADNTNKIQTRINISSTSPFYSDAKRLHVILSNIVSNSIRYADFTKPNPEITVKVVANSKLASIMIRDNGMGIKEEYKDKIYNMFFRATDKKTGSGLGLYIVKETILKLNGNIKMLSEHEHWTEFTIVLPNLLYKKLLSQQSLGTV
ncbi:MAG: sensor histidine kinase [Bacteroidetes bacterium]|nr:MAG: sensor histidine kinase [Bacteroidota bacterium]